MQQNSASKLSKCGYKVFGSLTDIPGGRLWDRPYFLSSFTKYPNTSCLEKVVNKTALQRQQKNRSQNGVFQKRGHWFFSQLSKAAIRLFAGLCSPFASVNSKNKPKGPLTSCRYLLSTVNKPIKFTGQLALCYPTAEGIFKLVQRQVHFLTSERENLISTVLQCRPFLRVGAMLVQALYLTHCCNHTGSPCCSYLVLIDHTN